MEIVTTFAATRRLVRGTGRGTVGLVPTMGALHAGHLSLVALARPANDTIVMSLFVNPSQFGEAADLERYPRDLDRDAGLAEAAGVDVLFVPDVDEVYPPGDATTVTVAGLTEKLEGIHRPGHFAGVTSVVARLFAGIAPDRAYFGRKDAQQLAVIRRMATDLAFPIAITGAPIVRDADGLALSSRNVFLSADERRTALALSQSLMLAADAVDAGERDVATLERAVWDHLVSTPGLEPEYAAVAGVADMVRPTRLEGPAFLAIAARVGSTRLIDNIHLDPIDAPGGGRRIVADRGVRLAAPASETPVPDAPTPETTTSPAEARPAETRPAETRTAETRTAETRTAGNSTGEEG